jgi:CBS domain-containing protein
LRLGIAGLPEGIDCFFKRKNTAQENCVLFFGKKQAGLPDLQDKMTTFSQLLRRTAVAREIPVVRDYTIPLERYPHLNEKKTLRDAAKVIHSFTAGEKDQLRYADALVVNDQNQLVGRITVTDILHGLAPQLVEATKINKFEGKTADFPNLALLVEDSFFKECSLRWSKPAGSFMSPVEHTVSADTHLLQALLVMLNARDFNLPVVANEEIVGVIRLEEIFKAISSHCNL